MLCHCRFSCHLIYCKYMCVTVWVTPIQYFLLNMYRSVLHNRTILQPYGAPSIAKRWEELWLSWRPPAGAPAANFLCTIFKFFFAPSPPFSIITSHSVRMKVWLVLHTIVLSAGQSNASFLSSPPLLLFPLKGSIWSPIINIQLLTMDDRGTKWADRSNLLNGPLL